MQLRSSFEEMRSDENLFFLPFEFSFPRFENLYKLIDDWTVLITKFRPSAEWVNSSLMFDDENPNKLTEINDSSV